MNDSAPIAVPTELPARPPAPAPVKMLTAALAPWLSRVAGSRAVGRVGILTYHRVHVALPDLPPPTWNVTPANFRAQIQGLLELGYQPCSLNEARAAQETDEAAKAKWFAVTFDDGYESVYRYAWPILRELNVPCTVFLATAYLDSPRPFPFDDWEGAGSPVAPPQSWRPLSTAHCREMQASGLVELGCHTHTHDDFRGRPKALRKDIEASLAVLKRRFGIQAAPFAFPYGIEAHGFASEELQEAARSAGVTYGLTTTGELVDPRSDPFGWGRFDVTDTDTAALLAAKLDGWYGLARSAWHSARQSIQALAWRLKMSQTPAG